MKPWKTQTRWCWCWSCDRCKFYNFCLSLLTYLISWNYLLCLQSQSLFTSISSFMGSSLVIIYIIVCTTKDFAENIIWSWGSMLPVFLVLPAVRIWERSYRHVLMPCKKYTLWYEQYHPPCSTFTYCACSKQTKILLQLANKPWLKQWTSLAWACFVYPSPTPSTLLYIWMKP